jgi:Fe-S oxidoreductase
VKTHTYPLSRKIARPVETRVRDSGAATLTSDCPMAGAHLAHGLNQQPGQQHPLSLLRKAYGI